MQNVEKEVNDGLHDASREIEREIEQVMEDLECWWADRTPTGTCAKYERNALMEACWASGKEWMWDLRTCLTYDEARLYWDEQNKI